MYKDFTSTPIFRKPALRFPAVGSQGEIEVPMVIDTQSNITRSPQLTTKSYMSIFTEYNPSGPPSAYGGTSQGVGVQGLAKLTISGYIETPTEKTVDNFATPLVSLDGKRITYGHLISYYFEGRINDWNIVKPLWFRDPFGRVFTKPRILEYDAQLVEAVPGRCTFNMVLQV